MALTRSEVRRLGIDLAADELVRRGFTVSPTQGRAVDVDLLVNDQQGRAVWSVKVYTNKKEPGAAQQAGWAVNRNTEKFGAANHVYIFVDLQQGGDGADQSKFLGDFLVASSAQVAKKIRKGDWFSRQDRASAEGWELFGDPESVSKDAPRVGAKPAQPGTQVTPPVPVETLPAAELEARNPRWTRDELILALDLYLTTFDPPLRQDSAAVAELSELLGRMAQVLGVRANADYRNANGVYMKLMNYRRLDPAYTDAGKAGLSWGNKDDAVVWTEFAGDRARLAATAAAIRAAVTADDADALAGADGEGMEEAPEGRVLTRLHRVRERSRELVETRKARALKATGRLRCEACGFDFQERYGERGRGFIEAHHTRPVHTLRPGERTKLTDLALVCANCHRMIHARRPWLSLDELRGKLVAAESARDEARQA